MSQVFKGQSSLVISLDTGIDLASAINQKILFARPNGEKGEWTATKSGTILSYQLQAGDINRDGMWSFQAYAEIAGKIHFGEIVQRLFLKPLK